VFEQDGRINVRVEGPWQDVILWEIPVLAIISEMRNRFRYPSSASARHWSGSTRRSTSWNGS
jgi:nicotinic acid phosphoribosyltransferase